MRVRQSRNLTLNKVHQQRQLCGACAADILALGSILGYCCWRHASHSRVSCLAGRRLKTWVLNGACLKLHCKVKKQQLWAEQIMLRLKLMHASVLVLLAEHLLLRFNTDRLCCSLHILPCTSLSDVCPGAVDFGTANSWEHAECGCSILSCTLY